MNRRVFAYLLSTACISSAKTPELRPKGLMLNLDFEGVKEGLIPNKALYPLFVPTGNLFVDRIKHRNLLVVDEGRGLDIPHSSLLDPAGDEWVVSIRVFLLTDGLILSQGNDRHGFAIYTKDHQVFARVRTGNVAYTLQEKPNSGISKFRKKWVTIELRISAGHAFLSLNRKYAAMVTGQPPLNGDGMRIRIGTHRELPGVFREFQKLNTDGFSGAINSLKIHRQ
ncbi:hypothetical protein [Pontiella agarivorans]|uniref:Uncharacterized protein n=1 Tax=Pontiella agarivorans TaxID=3038953 RepID=A0ABU5N1W3_9BACT|nr:hypothetical protein [Pontiella agarivorans]MDZ8120408.1 hypothetical protein [Pontiella agarivorans]